MSSITRQIEDGIISKISALEIGQPSGYLKTLRSYSGGFTEAEKEIVLSVPAVLVKLDEISTQQKGGATEVNSRWRLTIVDNSAYGEEARRRGVSGLTAHPGTYKILDDIKGLLSDEVLVSLTAPLKLVGEKIITVKESVSVIEQIWETFYFED